MFDISGWYVGALSELVTSFGYPVTAFFLYNINAPGLNEEGDPANGDHKHYGIKEILAPSQRCSVTITAWFPKKLEA